MNLSWSYPQMIPGQAPVASCRLPVLVLPPTGCSTEDARNPAISANHPLETNMITSTFDDNEILPLPVPGGRSAAALRYLMREWERDGAVDEGASESELMVLLSGMVSVSDPTLGDA